MQQRGGNQVQYTMSGDSLTFATVGNTSTSINLNHSTEQQYNQATTSTTSRNEQGQLPVPQTDGKVFPNIRCYECNQYGHYASHTLS